MNTCNKCLRIHGILLVLLLALVLSLSVGCDSDNESAIPTSASAPTTSMIEASTTQGEQDTITVISSDVEVDFPESLTFLLEAESASEITDLELRYKIEKVTTASVIATVTPQFDSGHNIETSWRLDNRKAGGLPPGATIRYYWIIGNASGVKTETEETSITFDDLRHDWKELAEGMVQLFWYKGGDEFGETLMAASQAALTKLFQDTGIQLDKVSKIYIYADNSDLQNSLIYAQEWTGGVAFTDYGIIVIGISPNNLDWGKRTIAHELTHIVVAQVTANPYTDIPTWLDEGLAMYIEGDLTVGFQEALSKAISSDSLFSVDSLSSSFPADPGEAYLAYAQSYSLVRFLIDEYGRDQMLELLQVFKDGNTQDDALLEAYGFDGDELEDHWRSSLVS